jgi:hypothetical protein
MWLLPRSKCMATFKYKSHWTIANMCTHAGEVDAPLDLVKDAKERIEHHGTMEDLESLGICGLEAYYDHPECMGAWLDGGWY